MERMVTLLAVLAVVAGMGADPAARAGASRSSASLRSTGGERRLVFHWPAEQRVRQGSEAFQQHLSDASKALSEGNLYAACRSARMARGLAQPAERAAAEAMLERINVEADKALASADRFLQAGQHGPAVRTFQWLSHLVPLPVAAEAARRLESEAVLAPVREQRAAGAYRTVLTIIGRQREATGDAGADAAPPLAEEAFAWDRPPATTQPAERTDADVVASMPPEQQAEVLSLLRTIARDYPGTETFEKARPLLMELARDGRITDAQDARQRGLEARQQMDLARNYIWNCLYYRAAECYRQVMLTFPATPEAEWAEEELRRLEARYGLVR